jgi:hypothetical protein
VLARSYVFAIVVGKILPDLRSAAVGAAAWRERPSDSAHNRFPQLRSVAWSVSGGTRRTPGKVRSVDVLPAEAPGIDGPGARSHHRQARAQDSQPDRNPGIAGVRERDPQFNNSRQRSDQRGPQTDNKKSPRAGSDDLGCDGRYLRCCTKIGNPTMKEGGAGKQTLGQKASAGPTVRESRE